MVVPAKGGIMIDISVKLYSSLKRYSKIEDGSITFSVKEGSTVGDILLIVGIMPGEAEIIRLNGKVVQEGEPILQKSNLEIFPIFGGG
jgi:sulfur carrier protein ThiS